jgi:hypothetical protein
MVEDFLAQAVDLESNFLNLIVFVVVLVTNESNLQQSNTSIAVVVRRRRLPPYLYQWFLFLCQVFKLLLGNIFEENPPRILSSLSLVLTLPRLVVLRSLATYLTRIVNNQFSTTTFVINFFLAVLLLCNFEVLVLHDFGVIVDFYQL